MTYQILFKSTKQQQHMQRIDQRLLLLDLNLFRAQPSRLYNIVQSRKQFYNSKNMLFSAQHPNRTIQTKQGPKALNQLLGQLLNDRHMPQMIFNNQLAQVAAGIAEYYKNCLSNNKPFDYSVGKMLREKLNTSTVYDFKQPIHCLIGVGFRDKFQPLISLLIDDGDPDRKNRHLLMNDQMKFCGISGVSLGDSGMICAVYLLTKQVLQK